MFVTFDVPGEIAATGGLTETVTYLRVINGRLVRNVKTYRNLKPHGTRAAHNRHVRRCEPICEQCREWSRLDVAADRAAGKQRGGRHRGLPPDHPRTLPSLPLGAGR